MGETHLRSIAGLHEVRIIAVADPRPEAAERGKALATAEAALTDIDQAITYPGVDAIIIVTPTETHARLIEAAMRTGKAVFSEKPIALDLGETSRVVRLVLARFLVGEVEEVQAWGAVLIDERFAHANDADPAVAVTKSWKEQRLERATAGQGGGGPGMNVPITIVRRSTAGWGRPGGDEHALPRRRRD